MSKENLETQNNPMNDMVSDLSEKTELVEELVLELIEMEDMPKNVSVSKPGICVSEWPIDVIYNGKMEKVRNIFTHTFHKVFPI